MENEHGRADSADSRSGEPGDRTTQLGKETESRFREAAEPIADKARAMAEEQKAAGAGQVSTLGRALHGAADGLGKELPQAASYIHETADRLESASTALRERSVEDIFSTFSDTLRRQPVAAFAGAVLAGIALSRVLKSSERKHQQRH